MTFLILLIIAYSTHRDFCVGRTQLRSVCVYLHVLFVLNSIQKPRTHISHIGFLFLSHPFCLLQDLCYFHFFSLFFSDTLFLSSYPLMHAIRFFSLIHQYTIVQRLPFSDANYLPKWGREALCLPAQSFIDRSVS